MKLDINQKWEEEERARKLYVFNKIIQKVNGLSPAFNPSDPSKWLSQISLSDIFPEYGEIDPKSLIAGDVTGIRCTELFRFFDKVIVRLQPTESEQEFRDIYFVTTNEMTDLIHRGYVLPLWCGREIPEHFRGLFSQMHIPKNDRMLGLLNIWVSQLAGYGPDKSPAAVVRSELMERFSKQAAPQKIADQMNRNMQNLKLFGFESLYREILATPLFDTASTLAFHAANFLTRPFTDTIGGVSLMNKGYAEAVWSRMAVEFTYATYRGPSGIWIPHQHPDLCESVFSSLGRQSFRPSERPPIIATDGNVRIEIAGQRAWNTLGRLILPMQDGIRVTTLLDEAAKPMVVERNLSYKYRKEMQVCFRDMLTAADFEIKKRAIDEIGRLSEPLESELSSAPHPRAVSILHGTIELLRKGVKYVPFVGDLADDILEIASARLGRDRRERILEAMGKLCDGSEVLFGETRKTTARLYPTCLVGRTEVARKTGRS